MGQLVSVSARPSTLGKWDEFPFGTPHLMVGYTADGEISAQ